jgi:hypothetical protein
MLRRYIMPNYKQGEMFLIGGIIEDVGGTTDPANPELSPKSGNSFPLRLNCKSEENELIQVIAWVDQGSFPPQIAKLDLDTIIGKSFRANAKFTGVNDYSNLPTFEIKSSKHYIFNLVGVSPAKDTSAEAETDGGTKKASPAPAPPSPPPSRTEMGMAKGNAISAITALIAAYVSKVGTLPPHQFLEQGAGLINYGSEAILSGRLTVPEQEAPADGSNDIDDGESFGVIQLGG